ncbi:caspase-2-like isoform X4 [Xyrauchen texanus]|uniref:caspase-2-like isoform X4 n=1 Tax=Xyrauchen texanus TaxID=154827 RepID=UPI0022424483|nr:caspase-2-like isoform X4 [Xyrauchen texanus]
MLGECGMKEWERLALRRNSVTLCKEMVVDDLLVQCLHQDEILTDSMAESIMAKPTSQGKSRHLLTLLPKRGPRAFSSFCAALTATEQLHLYRMLVEFTEKDKRFSVTSLSVPTQECVIPAKRTRTRESMEMCLDADSPVTTAVLPCTHEFYESHRLQAYAMRSSPRGLALVLSNVRFDSANTDLDIRRGGEVDEEVLRRLFTELDFTAMRRCLEQFAQRQEHAEYDCCAVCFLTHGVEGSIYGTDGQLLELDWVFEVFDNARCPLLQNKPKMFFIQACRGEEMDNGVDQLDGQEHTRSPGCDQRDAGREEERLNKEKEEKDRERVRVKLPQRSDMICSFASLKGFSTAAMRNTKKGSWFVQELNTAIRQSANDTHMSDILVQVNDRIKNREGYAPGSAHHRCKEMSEFTSSLCKDLYLFPKYYPNS